LPPSQNNIYLHHLNIKSEVDHRKIFESCHLPFLDVKQLAVAEFFFTNFGDVDCFALCGLKVGIGMKEMM
jgi:hypothetical protein